MRRLRHDDFIAGEIAARAVIGTDHGHAGEFAVRAGHGRERNALHACDLFQHFLQFEHAGEEALAQRVRRERVSIEKTRQHRKRITGFGVPSHDPRG